MPSSGSTHHTTVPASQPPVTLNFPICKAGLPTASWCKVGYLLLVLVFHIGSCFQDSLVGAAQFLFVFSGVVREPLLFCSWSMRLGGAESSNSPSPILPAASKCRSCGHVIQVRSAEVAMSLFPQGLQKEEEVNPHLLGTVRWRELA